MTNYTRHPASYRDPAGFVWVMNGQVYRQVNQSYAADYDLFTNSGLYQDLVNKKLLIAHSEINENLTGTKDWYKTLLPQKINFISYPYEWSFAQLKDAALLTLNIAKSSIERGMILKDATPYNIQFLEGKPVMIDTLSFTKYDASKPWIAYRQFCETFLYPLFLEKFNKLIVHQTFSAWPDGIPASETACILPSGARFNLAAWLHIYLQTMVGKNKKQNKADSGFDKKKMLNLLQHLESTIKSLSPPASRKTVWSNYYDETILGKDYLKAKEKLFTEYISDWKGKKVLDLGANDGYFSRIMSENSAAVVSADSDDRCIQSLYEARDKKILPLILDISNPSPAGGFLNKERKAFHDRISVDAVTALALIHHLAIGKNIPLDILADYFNKIAPELVIEFVPKEDPKVQELLKNREDIFNNYTVEAFEKEFSLYFEIIKNATIPGTSRRLYRMKRKNQ